MIVEQIEADFFGTNCWVISTTKNRECIIVDPGIVLPSIYERVSAMIKKHNLKPVAVILTHGHFDHMFSVQPVADGYDIPALIHQSDAPALSDIWHLTMKGGPVDSLMSQFGNPVMKAPAKIEALSDSKDFEIAGMKIHAEVAPGHTRGSTIFTINDAFLLSGDVLFAGSIGRTDLPTGSTQEMKKTLSTKIVTLPNELIVLPGHGPQTTMAKEKSKNPYLQEDFLVNI